MKFMFRKLNPIPIFLIVSCVLGQVAFQQQAVADEVTVTQLSTVEGITEYELNNGLKILLFPDQSKQQITVNITYLVGSRHEGYGETGMAHLLEHMLFQGSTKHPDIPKELSDRGASPNGTTWLDRTNYFETFTATDDNLDWALDLEADRMVNSFVKAEDLESEMTVVRNEMESGENSPGRVLSQRVSSAAYLWHNYGNSTIGARADVENVPITRLQAFYRKYYQPDNAILVVAGKFDTERALELIKEKFGPIPRPIREGENVLYSTYTREPAQDGERTVVLRRVGDNQIVSMAHHIPAATHPDFAALSVLGALMSHIPSGRLYKALVETELATSASMSSFPFREPTLLWVSAYVRKEKSLDVAEQAALEVVEQIKKEAPSQAEVDRIQNEYAAMFESSYTNPQAIGRQLSEYAAQGDWRMLFISRDRVQEVTPEDVQRVAQKYLVHSNRTTGYFYPTEDTPPRVTIDEAPDISTIVDGYVGREDLVMGEAFDPSYVNIDSRTERLALDNGAKVALLEKKTRGAMVSLRMTFRHGSEDMLTDVYPVSGYTGGLLMRGTQSKSREEIRDLLTKLNAQGTVSGGLTSSSVSFTTKRDSLPELLPLIAEILKEPAMDEKEFEIMREQRLASIEGNMKEPQANANLRLSQHINQYPEGHPYHVYSFEDQLEKHKAVTLEDVKDFHADFYGAQNGMIVLIGDFDRNGTVALLNEHFGDWYSASVYERIQRQYTDLETISEVIETPDKSNAVMYAIQTLPLRDDHEDYPALLIGGEILGGGFLSSRLATRIRQNDGLSYGVGSQFGASSFDEYATVSGYAIYAPENSERVLGAFSEELQKIRDSGFTEEEVEDAKQAIIESNKTSLASDGTVASMLLSNLELNRTMQFRKGVEDAMLALTVDEVNDTFNNYIDMEAMSVFRAGDFAKAKTASAE